MRLALEKGGVVVLAEWRKNDKTNEDNLVLVTLRHGGWFWLPSSCLQGQ